MISANELRISNWVKHSGAWSVRNDKGLDNIVFQWSDIDFYHIHECTLSYEFIEPIPLDEDILLKCGFRRHDSILWAIDNDGFISIQERGTWVNGKPDGEISYVLYKGAAGAICDLKYLHHLQNIYFDICGKELNIPTL